MKENNREEALALLKELQDKGYQYVVRDKGMGYLCCFSLKPKKYQCSESWGYVDPDSPAVMMAEPIKNTDIREINWNNRSATLISDMFETIDDLFKEWTV